MMRAPAALVFAALLSAAVTASQLRTRSADVDFVELDATVVDGKGRAVHGLAQGDFTIKEDGKPVELTAFREVRGPVRNDPDSARTVVLLLDDTGVMPGGTKTIQAIARAFVSSAQSIDDMPVVRLHAKGDEPYGDRIAGEGRIADYRGGAYPFIYWSTTGDVLERVSEISRLVSSNVSTRKIIVCIGSPYICNVDEPEPSGPRSFTSLWERAISDAAKTNAAIYALIPGRASRRGGGLPEMTGGEVFATTYDVGPPIDRILQDASNYYVLGYWPRDDRPELHRVEVKVKTRGARVHARRLR